MAEQPIFKYLHSVGALKNDGTFKSTVGFVNRKVYLALKLMERWDAKPDDNMLLVRADSHFDKAINREDASSNPMHHGKIWSYQAGEKKVTTFNITIEKRLKDSIGGAIILKEYAQKEKVAMITDFWTELELARGKAANIPYGEIAGMTDRRTVSFMFEGRNLFYDFLYNKKPTEQESICLARSILKINFAMMVFTGNYLMRRRIVPITEEYAAKSTKSIHAIQASFGVPTTGFSNKQLESMTASLGASTVPFTDFKSPNLIVNPEASLDDVIAGNGLRIIDCDKIDRAVSRAHNLAHVIFDPAWNITLDDRLLLCGQNGLLGTHASTSVLGIAYYLSRQVAISLDKNRDVDKSIADKEKTRHNGFYDMTREFFRHPFIVRALGDYSAFIELGDLPIR